MSALTRPDTSAVADLFARFWSEVDNADWLAARELMRLSSRVSGFFAQFVGWDEHGEVQLDWEAAAQAATTEGFSSTEARLVDLCLALTLGASVTVQALSRMGSWDEDVWRVLTEWATQGRVTTAPSGAGTAHALDVARHHLTGGFQ